MKRTITLSVALAALLIFSVGCAITDYGGWTGHKTQGQARLWGSEIAFSGTGTGNDGTYAYAVGYDASKPGYSVRIDSLFNPVFAAFSRDGGVDRDAEGTKGKAGSLTFFPATPAGKFGEGYVSIDKTPGGNCEFFDNITQSKIPAAGIALCDTAAEEEVDSNDSELQNSFASADDLLRQIWSGQLTGNFTMEVAAINLNGTRTALVQPASIGATVAPLRPTGFRITNSAGVRELVNAILANSTNRQAVSGFSLELAGGAVVSLPRSMSIAFDHDRLRAMFP